MCVRLIVVIIVADILVTVEGTDGMLLGEFPIEADIIAHLLQTPGIEEFDIGVWRNSQSFLVVLYLQTTAKHVFALAGVGLLLAIVGIIQITPALADSMRRTIGVLPALTQGEAEVTEEFLIECQ